MKNWNQFNKIYEARETILTSTHLLDDYVDSVFKSFNMTRDQYMKVENYIISDLLDDSKYESKEDIFTLDKLDDLEELREVGVISVSDLKRFIKDGIKRNLDRYNNNKSSIESAEDFMINLKELTTIYDIYPKPQTDGRIVDGNNRDHIAYTKSENVIKLYITMMDPFDMEEASKVLKDVGYAASRSNCKVESITYPNKGRILVIVINTNHSSILKKSQKKGD